MDHDLKNQYDVVVVGAGVAGLCAALAASTGTATVAVLDGHPVGGRARSVERHGFTLNQGAHALYLNGAFRRVLNQHGIEPAGASPDVSSVKLLRDGRLTRQSFTATGLASSKVLSIRSRVKALGLFGKLPKMRAATWVGRSVAEWLGDEPDDLRQMVETLVRLATYSNDPQHFDAGAAVAQLQLSLGGVRYVDGGWQQIIDSMVTVLRQRGVHVEQQETTAVERGRVIGSGGDIAARSIVVATGGPAVVERLTGQAVAGATMLTAPSTATVLDLCLTRPHDGVTLGLDRPYYLSPHAPLALLAPPNGGLVTLMAYHRGGDKRAVELTRTELREMAGMAGVTDDIVEHERFLAECTVAHGGPSATAGGMAGRPSIDALDADGVLIAGDWVGPEGLIADCSAASGAAAGTVALLAAQQRSTT
jgi:phytoene dehydrogenase-like protein